MIARFCLVLTAFALLAASAFAQSGPVTVSSPNGEIRMTFATLAAGAPADAGGQLSYQVTFQGKPVFNWSQLAMDIQSQRLLGDAVKILSSKAGSGDETYTLVHGKSNPVRNLYNSVVIELEEPAAPRRRLTIEARAYNDGAAFRYVVPDQVAVKELRLANERTQFNFSKDATTYPLILAGYRTSYEDSYHKLPLSSIHPDYLVAHAAADRAARSGLGRADRGAYRELCGHVPGAPAVGRQCAGIQTGPSRGRARAYGHGADAGAIRLAGHDDRLGARPFH